MAATNFQRLFFKIAMLTCSFIYDLPLSRLAKIEITRWGIIVQYMSLFKVLARDCRAGLNSSGLEIMNLPVQPLIPSKTGEPAWEVTQFFPLQGQWNEADYFRIHTNQMAELVDGRLEILPMPTWLHQLIVDFLLTEIKNFLQNHHKEGVVLFAPLPVKLFAGTVREPDLLYVRPENIPTDLAGYPEKIDLAVEVVSEGADASKRDYFDKRLDYAKAGISEYWIVDPEQSMFTVLTLEGYEYRVFMECRAGETARSLLLDGLSINVDDILALGKKP